MISINTESILQMMNEECREAFESFPDYSPAVLVTPENETKEAHKRAMLQTMFRLSLLQVEAHDLLVQYTGLDHDAPIATTTELFLRSTILNVALNHEQPIEHLEKLGKAFGIDLSPEKEVLIEELKNLPKSNAP